MENTSNENRGSESALKNILVFEKLITQRNREEKNKHHQRIEQRKEQNQTEIK